MLLAVITSLAICLKSIKSSESDVLCSPCYLQPYKTGREKSSFACIYLHFCYLNGTMFFQRKKSKDLPCRMEGSICFSGYLNEELIFKRPYPSS